MGGKDYRQSTNEDLRFERMHGLAIRLRLIWCTITKLSHDMHSYQMCLTTNRCERINRCFVTM